MGRGEVIVREGEQDHSVFVIARGTVVVERRHVTPVELGIGCVFGEINWALGTKRTATIRAMSPGFLYRIQGERLADIAARRPALLDRIWASAGVRIAENLMHFMPAFSGLTASKLRGVVQQLRLRHCHVANAPKTCLFHRKGYVFLVQGFARLRLDALSPKARNGHWASPRSLSGPNQPQAPLDFAPKRADGSARQLERGENEVWNFSAPCLISPETVEAAPHKLFAPDGSYQITFSQGARYVVSQHAELQNQRRALQPTKSRMDVYSILAPEDGPVRHEDTRWAQAPKTPPGLRQRPPLGVVGAGVAAPKRRNQVSDPALKQKRTHLRPLESIDVTSALISPASEAILNREPIQETSREDHVSLEVSADSKGEKGDEETRDWRAASMVSVQTEDSDETKDA
eukprot:scaffold6610_cov245-Pinguiococcus_pyrenoidosus.AAC.5